MAPAGVAELEPVVAVPEVDAVAPLVLVALGAGLDVPDVAAPDVAVALPAVAPLLAAVPVVTSAASVCSSTTTLRTVPAARSFVSRPIDS